MSDWVCLSDCVGVKIKNYKLLYGNNSLNVMATIMCDRLICSINNYNELAIMINSWCKPNWLTENIFGSFIPKCNPYDGIEYFDKIIWIFLKVFCKICGQKHPIVQASMCWPTYFNDFNWNSLNWIDFQRIAQANKHTHTHPMWIGYDSEML